ARAWVSSYKELPIQRSLVLQALERHRTEVGGHGTATGGEREGRASARHMRICHLASSSCQCSNKHSGIDVPITRPSADLSVKQGDPGASQFMTVVRRD